MVNPEFIAELPLSLGSVQEILSAAEKRDGQLSFISNKVKEYLEAFQPLEEKKSKALQEKLVGLQLTRLKEEHIMKILDFLPRTVNELKVVLQAYPLSMPRKDQESIVAAVNELVPKN